MFNSIKTLQLTQKTQDIHNIQHNMCDNIISFILNVHCIGFLIIGFQMITYTNRSYVGVKSRYNMSHIEFIYLYPLRKHCEILNSHLANILIFTRISASRYLLRWTAPLGIRQSRSTRLASRCKHMVCGRYL